MDASLRWKGRGTVDELLDVVVARVENHSSGVRRLAAAGEPFFARLIEAGVIDGLRRALDQLEHDRDLFEGTHWEVTSPETVNRPFVLLAN